MMRTIISIQWLNLRRDAVALVMMLALPIAFFSIFAALFGGGAAGASFRIGVVVVDRDDSPLTRQLIDGLRHAETLRIKAVHAGERLPGDVRALLQPEDANCAIVLAQGAGARLLDGKGRAEVQVFCDPSVPGGPYIVSEALRQAAWRAAPQAIVRRLTADAPALSDAQKTALIRAFARAPEDGNADGLNVPLPPPMDLLDIRKQALAPQRTPISYYAAGIGVMFLLFSMAAAGGVLLEQRENGTLERLLNTNLSMGRLLMASWAFYTVVGFVQLLTMFVWGNLAFDLALWTIPRLTGTLVVTLVTAASAAALGILLAALCDTRARLTSISTIFILVMSALGGSMMPRFLMSDLMQSLSHLTFNGWALDAYLAVFSPAPAHADLAATLQAALPALGVLGAATVVLLLAATRLARKWEYE